ncbi:MAG: dihydrofolate reductase [Candidatus Nealsonbacteria bacterium]
MKGKDKSLISIIVAIGKKNVIGINNSLPWDLPADMEHFHKMTKGKPVLMGQRTFESISKPLPGRINAILTLDKNFSYEGCLIFYSIEEALEGLKEYPEIMICGGVSIYKQFLPLADRMYLTFIDGEFEGDAFFPEIDYSQWKETERIEKKADNQNQYNCAFVTFNRIK